MRFKPLQSQSFAVRAAKRNDRDRDKYVAKVKCIDILQPSCLLCRNCEILEFGYKCYAWGGAVNPITPHQVRPCQYYLRS